MSKFKRYIRTNIAEMREYVPGEDLSGVSVSAVDTPTAGDMIARNPKNHADQWLVAEKYFKENFAAAEVESAEPDYWVSTDGVYVDFGMRRPMAEDDGANWCARTEVNQHINDSMGDQLGLRLHLEALYRHPPSAVPEGYVLVEKSVVPEHVLAAGSAAIVCAMQAGITSPRTLALAAYTDMVLAAAPQGGGDDSTN